jgi:iron complex outermembrane recepter protein
MNLVLTHAEYDPNKHIEIFGSYGHGQLPETYEGPYYGVITDIAGDVTVYELPFRSDARVDDGRVGGRLKFATGRLQHQLTVTGDFVHQRDRYFYESINPLQTNMYHPVSLAPLVTHTQPLTDIGNVTDLVNESFAVADVMTAFSGKLVLIGGLRNQVIDATTLGSNSRGANNANIFTPCTGQCEYDKTGLGPSGAGLYHITSRLSIYANYIQDLEQGPTAPVEAMNAGQVFPPAVSEQEEAGVKYELKHPGATFALFRITEPNAVLNPSTSVFGLSGQQRNLGLEAEFFGNVTSAVRLTGGFTLLNARQQNTGDPTTDGKRAEGVPSVQLTENAEWNVSHVKSLVLTSRVTASSGQYACIAETQRIPAWARLDIGGRYTLPFRYEPTLRVNVENVTGHNYWESGLDGLNQGAPRSLRVSTGFRF